MTRWMTPQEVRRFIEKHTKLHKGRKANAHQKGLAAGMLEACFMDDPERKRRSVLEYLFGVDSMKQVKDEQVCALLDWLAPEKIDGQWLPAEKAVKEANAILSAFLEERGQERLL